MGASNEQGQGRIFYKLKVEKETNIPLFMKQKKDSNGAWVVDETFNAVAGFLKSVELGSYVWEGDTIDTLKFLFDDDSGGSPFQVECGFNYLSRNILNTLAGSDTIGHVKMKVYSAPAKDKSGKVFPAIYIEVNKVKAGWKYKPEETPKAKEVKVGGKTLKDTTELDEFFKLLIPEINSKIVSEFEVETEMKNPYPQASGNTNTVDESPRSKAFTGSPDDMPKDDLPF